jgi:hypothetical protein
VIGVKVPEPRDPSPSELFVLEALRKRRRQRHAGRSEDTRGGRKRRAVLTMVHNEPVFLPIWLRYYSRFFGADDIYVLDNDTSDGSTEPDGFVRIADVDEIVTPRPECGTLAEYIDRLDEEFVNCLGYELIHLVDREGPFDPSRAVLEQRGYWFLNHAYNKPALAMEPIRWVPGFHAREDGRTELDPDLCMIHLHRMDYEICLARHRYRRGRPWNERDLAENWARHNLIVDEAEFARWFYESHSFDEFRVQVQPIPASWRGLF